MRHLATARITLVLALMAWVLPSIGAAAEQGEHPLDGAWYLQTTGEWARKGEADRFSLEKWLTMENGSFTENPIGYPDPQPTDWKSLRPGGSVHFMTPYLIGGSREFAIEWKGRIDRGGTQITDGEFSHMMGGGTFTAHKADIAPAFRSTPRLRKDEPETFEFRLTAPPDKPVVITFSTDERTTIVGETSRTIQPDAWEEPVSVELTKAAGTDARESELTVQVKGYPAAVERRIDLRLSR